MMNSPALKFHPATIKRWKDIEKLFGERGACGGCWCMTWRLTSREFDKNKGEGNKKLLKKIIDGGKEPGIIAYDEKGPAGWCAFAPREEYIRLEKSRVLKRIDDKPVLSVTCFFVRKDLRRTGLSTKLLAETIAWAKKKKIKIIEGYPVTPYTKNMPAPFAWTGLPGTFEKAGFKIAAKQGSRVIMRYYL
jgi:GNAT superfamily N-acetyltransferase